MVAVLGPPMGWTSAPLCLVLVISGWTTPPGNLAVHPRATVQRVRHLRPQKPTLNDDHRSKRLPTHRRALLAAFCRAVQVMPGQTVQIANLAVRATAAD